MSDRKSRDRGTKKQQIKDFNLCGCWLCTDGKTKKRILTGRVERKYRDKRADDE